MTDSSVQLTEEEIKKYDITVVPLSVTIDGKTYVDGVDITRRDFIERMDEDSDVPKTSQPPIGRFVETIKKLTADGSEVLGIFLAKSLSGTIDAAKQAASIVPDAKVVCHDSGYTDRSEGYEVIAAAQDAQAGKSIDEILDHLKKMEDNMYLEMMIPDLTNIVKGGRLGKLASRVVSMLNIRISLQMKNGKVLVPKKGRGKKFTEKFNDMLVEQLKELGDQVKQVGISYVDTLDAMEKLAARFKEVNPNVDILIRKTSPIIITHAGHGAYAVMFYTE
ncbi:DegV family protein [Lactobacillus helveticus]|uniref:DegV domain-containing protein n=1 Tax=Lactobacillus helveticus TaxID=1587 RepID=A0A9Q5C2T9_LACHE|nr:DegV family protein [Lactobacillus helveticus]NRN89786.1 DegV domain-containing protein [Lactobacillus helveticus]NRN94186.1 DegV domain-containing protein [Lactobacillus helveticus]NRO21567.1 DegV domain-containing protein [Lactobacillus helveticus]NRO27045.1 DegV domain-containing protein [Lactobacillus helveticus]NRO31337.1 DegV domain-containing protein [Lactobacillus helveticus]